MYEATLPEACGTGGAQCSGDEFSLEAIDLAVVAHGCHGHLKRSLAFQTASKQVSLSPVAISCGYTGVVAWLML